MKPFARASNCSAGNYHAIKHSTRKRVVDLESTLLDGSMARPNSEENGSSGDSLEYMYSDPSVVTTPSKDINMPSEEVKFTLDDVMLSKLSKSAGMIGAPDLLLENNKLTVRDKKNDSGNCCSTNVDAQGSGTYKFYFKTENLKLIPGSYDVTVSSKKISSFKNGKTQYWIALEPESMYSA